MDQIVLRFTNILRHTNAIHCIPQWDSRMTHIHIFDFNVEIVSKMKKHTYISHHWATFAICSFDNILFFDYRLSFTKKCIVVLTMYSSLSMCDCVFSELFLKIVKYIGMHTQNWLYCVPFTETGTDETKKKASSTVPYSKSYIQRSTEFYRLHLLSAHNYMLNEATWISRISYHHRIAHWWCVIYNNTSNSIAFDFWLI